MSAEAGGLPAFPVPGKLCPTQDLAEDRESLMSVGNCYKASSLIVSLKPGSK